ncbi:MAG: hypothetical protein HY017_27740 [Betaproteobacteria bacterium]|nr:hypothetical protein [Betaproteobacteria bacterium]
MRAILLLPGAKALAAVAALWVAGCASLDIGQGEVVARPAEDRQCEAWFAALDAQVDAAGVRDAEATRVAGFPQLRVDRFLASFRGTVKGDHALAAWLERMRELDRNARAAELANLPESAIVSLAAGAKSSALERTDACGRQLVASDLRSPGRMAVLRAHAEVPDDYLAWQRALGLYPLARLPFSAGVQNWHDEALAEFSVARTAPPDTPRGLSYALAQQKGSRAAAEQIMHRAARDALGVPRFTEQQREQLLAAHAPVLEVQTTGDYDRLGRPRFDARGLPSVDISRPVLFGRVAWTRYGDQTLVQLAYTGWFPERPAEGSIDLLGGALDGVVWRVTLGPDGAPLVYDTIHPCGCYHMFFPTSRAEPREAPDPQDEWAFVPASLGVLPAGTRIRIRIATRTHYLIDVAADDSGSASAMRYILADENGLRVLPLPGGGTRSLYGPDGLVAGSERLERFLFWPMGVPSAGTMRQWGRHATAFLGRRHFDDADLIERRFRLELR